MWLLDINRVAHYAHGLNFAGCCHAMFELLLSTSINVQVAERVATGAFPGDVLPMLYGSATTYMADMLYH